MNLTTGRGQRAVYYGRRVRDAGRASAILTVRLGADLARALAREARRRRKTKTELVREILAAELGGDPQLLGREARRQSLLVSRRSSEREALEFVERNADTRGWTVS
jgi:hypothetical protein